MNDESCFNFAKWIIDLKPTLDDVCAAALADGAQGVGETELREAHLALLRLRDGEDVDYKLPGIAALYTAHYHGKRVHAAMRVLGPRLESLLSRPCQVVDVGAGTYAVRWAWALCASFLRSRGHDWLSIDSSDAMLRQGGRLWRELKDAIPRVAMPFASINAKCVDWTADLEVTPDAVLVGSYPFASSMTVKDVYRLIDAVQRWRIREIVLWTAPRKAYILGWIERCLRQLGSWRINDPLPNWRSPLTGGMDQTDAIARSVLGYFRRLPYERVAFRWGSDELNVEVLAAQRAD